MKSCRIFIIVASSLILSCNKENQIIEPISVKTTGATASPSGGVSVSGALTAFQKIEDYGFILTLNHISRAYSMGRPTASGSFSYEIDSDLQPGRYVYAAYVRHETGVAVGDTLSFVYFKNKAPVIESLSPSIGHIGDTITLSGSNFGSYSNNIMLGTTSTYPTFVRNNTIKIIIPASISAGTSVVSLVKDGITYPSPTNFELYKPVITGISPSSGEVRTIIEIDGSHFDISEAGNVVKIGDVPALIISASRTKIKAVVPDDLTTADASVTVFAQNSLATSPVNFKINPPSLTGVPSDGFTLTTVSIKGNGFHPTYYKNKVSFGGIEGVVQSNSTSKELFVQVPSGPYPNREVTVQMSVYEQMVTWPQKFTIDDPWLMVANPVPFIYDRGIGAFAIDHKAYVIAPSYPGYPDGAYYLWTMNNTDFTWTKRAIPFSGQGWSGICVANGSKAYFYTADASADFWEFDPAVNTWTALPDFIGKRRDKPGMFTIGEDIYVGWGSDFSDYNVVAFRDFYRYRPSTQSWIKIAEPATESLYTGRTETSSFTIDGFGYIGCGARTTGQVDFWKYDPTADQWSREADIGPSSYTSSFSLNGKGYIVGGGFTSSSNALSEYTPSSNTWRNADNTGLLIRSGTFSIVLDDVPFVGGGDYNQGLFMLDVSRMK